MINRLLIVGVGLIGGSLALALKKARFVRTIVGVGRSQVNLDLAKDLKMIDVIATNLSEAITEADLIVLAAPLGVTRQLFQELKPILSEKTVVTDVGSVKSGVVDDAREQLGSLFSRFVPGHPIAGSEAKGPKAAFADLFLNHHVLLTPVPETDPGAVELVKKMWRAAGARVTLLSHSGHDQNLALTSHLPHVLAYVLMNLVHNKDSLEELVSMMGGGFRDTTRIASSDPEIWKDIIIANRREILNACSQYNIQLTKFVDALEAEDENLILEFIKIANKTRDACLIPDANDG